MRKNMNPNSTARMPVGFSWKLGFFFSWICLLFSNPLWAVGENHSKEIVDSAYSGKNAQAEVSALYITEGAVVYGMEHITQYSAPVSPVQKRDKKNETPKLSPKKQKITGIRKNAEQKPQKTFSPAKNTAVLLPHPSDNAFRKGKTDAKEGTITLNPTFKSAILITKVSWAGVLSHGTNLSYKHLFFYAGGGEDSRFFTRPPPFYGLLII